MSLILETNDSDYILTKKLGNGGTCQCFEGFLSSDITRKLLAIKIFQEKAKRYFQKEVLFNEHLTDENFLQIQKHGVGYLNDINSNSKKPIFFIIQDLAENGELFDYIYLLKKPFSEKISAKIFYKIIKLIKYLHERKIAHCDIKLENILVDNNFNLKLIDFGFSHKISKNNKNNLIYIFQGTQTYCSPESTKPFLGYDPFVHDIFSLGVVLFILTVGRFPFNQANYNDTRYRLIMKGDFKNYWDDFEQYMISDELKSLINKLICYDPSERYNLNEILEHPWIKKYCNESDNDFWDEVKEELQLRKSVMKSE